MSADYVSVTVEEAPTRITVQGSEITVQDGALSVVSVGTQGPVGATGAAGATGATGAAGSIPGAIDATTYGVAGSGSTSLTDFQSAIDAAIAANKALLLPPGTITVTFTVGTTKLTIGGNLVLRGAGRDQTTIQFGPSPPTFLYYGFEWEAKWNVEFHDMTLAGPADAGVTPPTVPTYGILSLHQKATSAGTGRCLVSRVNFTGRGSPFGCDAGVASVHHTLEIRECDFTGYYVLLGYFSADGATRRLHVHDSRFHGVADLGSNTGEDVYVHPNVSVHIERCLFEDNPYYSVQHYGSSPTASCEYSRYVDCHWASAVGNALYLGNKGPSLVSGCHFHVSGTAITFRDPTQVVGCLFQQSAGTSACFNSLLSTGETATIDGCLFDMSGTAQGAVCGGTGTYWWFTGCEFRVAGTSAGLQVINTASAYLRDCHFYGGSAGVALAAYAGVTFSFLTCVFDGTWDGTAGPIAANGGVFAYGEVRDCTFNVSGTAAYVGSGSGSSYAGLLRFEGNYYNGCLPQSRASHWQHGQLRRGLGADVSSAATITPDVNSDCHHVTGTTTIDTITLGNDALAHQSFHGARLTLIFDSTAATSSAGNIYPKSTGARTAHTAATFVLDAASNKWVET